MSFSMFPRLGVTWVQALVLWSSPWRFTMSSMLLKIGYYGMLVIRFQSHFLWFLKLAKHTENIARGCVLKFGCNLFWFRSLTLTKSWLEEEIRCIQWDRQMGYQVSPSALRVNMIALALVIVLLLSQQAWVILSPDERNNSKYRKKIALCCANVNSKYKKKQ